MMICKNCGNEAEGKFCSQCGQSMRVDKITYSSLVEDLSVGFFQVHRGFFYTVGRLFTNPGESIRQYLQGARKKHFKPITYVLTLSTMYFLVTELTGQLTWMEDFVIGFSEGAEDAGNANTQPKLLLWFSRNYAYSTLLLLPFFSLASFIAFAGKGRSYLEHIVLNSFITGQQAIIYGVFVGVKTLFSNDFLEFVPVVCSIAYTCWVFWQFFEEGSRFANVFRSLFTYIIYMLISTGLLILGIALSEHL